MTFECRKCKKRWDVEGYSKEGTFFTLCADCGAQALRDFQAMEDKARFIRVCAILDKMKKEEEGGSSENFGFPTGEAMLSPANK